MCGLCPTIAIDISVEKNPSLVLPLRSSTSYYYSQLLEANNYLLPSMIGVPAWEGKWTSLGLRWLDDKLDGEEPACLKLAVWHPRPSPGPCLWAESTRGLCRAASRPKGLRRGQKYSSVALLRKHKMMFFLCQLRSYHGVILASGKSLFYVWGVFVPFASIWDKNGVK